MNIKSINEKLLQKSIYANAADNANNYDITDIIHLLSDNYNDDSAGCKKKLY